MSKTIEKSWFTSINDENEAKLCLSLSNKNNNQPKRIIATFRFGKPGMLFPFRYEETSFIHSAEELLNFAQESILLQIERTYYGSEQPVPEIVDFVSKCFQEFKIRS